VITANGEARRQSLGRPLPRPRAAANWPSEAPPSIAFRRIGQSHPNAVRALFFPTRFIVFHCRCGPRPALTRRHPVRRLCLPASARFEEAIGISSWRRMRSTDRVPPSPARWPPAISLLALPDARRSGYGRSCAGVRCNHGCFRAGPPATYALRTAVPNCCLRIPPAVSFRSSRNHSRSHWTDA